MSTGKRVLAARRFQCSHRGGRRTATSVITDDTRMKREPADDRLPAASKRARRSLSWRTSAGRKAQVDLQVHAARRSADHLHSLIGHHQVAFSRDDRDGHECRERIIAKMHNGDVTVLENVRFHAGRGEANDPAFAKQLAEARRPLRQRRLRRGAPRARLHVRHRRSSPAAGGDGPAHGEGAATISTASSRSPSRPFLSSSSAAPKSRTRSASSKRLWRRPMASSSAAPWPTPSTEPSGNPDRQEPRGDR